ncbi:hypothetical protein [Streptomyces sp. NPDC018045]|uniref:hypothetical protein n=1 Tax=Streptomyces sp. NPDC018045 TaxID=3365037 RepID=UPI0037BB6E0F
MGCSGDSGAGGGREGELYVNGQALTRQWADELRTKVPELPSDLDRLQAMRAEWLDAPSAARSHWPAVGYSARPATGAGGLAGATVRGRDAAATSP